MSRIGTAFSLLPLLLITACFSARRMEALKRDRVTPGLSAADYYRPELVRPDSTVCDTMKVRDSDGRELLIMRAVRDEDGKMVATERLAPSIVVSSFRNVAERNGKVDLRFRIAVPISMIESSWQLCVEPVMYIQADTVPLDRMIVSGERYRDSQIRSLEAYRRYLRSITDDPSAFLRDRELSIFLQRRRSLGIPMAEAEDHYTWHLLKELNELRRQRSPRMYSRLVKSPIEMSRLRLDTVIVRPDVGFEYEYVQSVATRPGLRKIEIGLRSSLRDVHSHSLYIPDSLRVSFYISSLSTLVKNTVKYKTEIISRRVSDNSVCWIEFPVGSSDLDESLGNNESEMSRIKNALRDLVSDRKYDMDSIVVVASSSPEGSFAANRKLSQKRSESVCRYYEAYARSLRDSVKAEEGVRMTLEGSEVESPRTPLFSFRARFVAENWDMFGHAIREDAGISPQSRTQIDSLLEIPDPDLREYRLSVLPCYRYLRENIYPRLRTVKFNFYLHRKGMVKDTLHTTVVDSTYSEGLDAMRDRDYRRALLLLSGYKDYNTAVACVALDRNATALEILLSTPGSAPRDYLLAIVYSRLGRDRDAVQAYLDACAADRTFVHRGNLDPEIQLLTSKYALNNEN